MARTVPTPPCALPPPKEPALPAIPGETDFALGSDASTRRRTAVLSAALSAVLAAGPSVLMKGMRVEVVDVIENQRDRGFPCPVLRRNLAVAVRGAPGHGPLRAESGSPTPGLLRSGHRGVRRTALGDPGGIRRR